MDMWTKLSFGTDLGLDLLDQPNGLFGDLKDTSRLQGDMDPARMPRDAVEHLTDSPLSESLDHEWMESGDLSTFLAALDNGQDKLQETSLFDCSQELALKDITSNAQVKFENYFVVSDESGFLSPGISPPPESPEQVAPVIKLDPEIDDGWTSNSYVQDITPPVTPVNISFSAQEFVTSPELNVCGDFQIQENFLEVVESKSELFDESDILGLAFNQHDIENVLGHVDLLGQEHTDVSFSVSTDQCAAISPSEPTKPSIDTLIQSSPELYKVIATPLNVSTRFSPYCKVTDDRKSKTESKSSKAKKENLSSELIPEEVITSSLGKKERKKLQNKNAAIRYRQKKKVEVENIVTEVQGLEDSNRDLKSKVDDLQREIKYMKNLMEDIYKAKGIV